MNCRKCKAEVSSTYCPECGQAVELKRIDGHYLLHEFEHLIHFERGILYTVKELVIRPKQTVKLFLEEDRSRLVKPLLFIILTSLFYAVAERFFHLQQGIMDFDVEGDSSFVALFNWMQAHYGYANLIIGSFIAAWISLLFKRYGYNFFEVLVMLCYIIGIQMLLYSIFVVMEGVSGIGFMRFAGIIGTLYLVWAIGDFFERKISNYIKALTSIALGTVSAFGLLILLGLLMDGLLH